MGLNLEIRRRWFAQGAEAWHRAQLSLGVPASDAKTGIYVCPLCLKVDHDQRRAQFTCHTEEALTNGTLTVEDVPPRSLGGRPLLLTCKNCNNWAGHELDAHARRRENPRDAFLGRATTKVSLTMDGHRLAGGFTVRDGQYCFEVTSRRAFRPGAIEGFRQKLEQPEGIDRDMSLGFDHDRFDGDRARVSWLRAAYLTLFSVAGFRAILGPEMELVRRQIREPKTSHIPTFLIDTGGGEDWSHRAFIKIKEPEWQRCWGIAVGHYVVCLPLPGDRWLYERIASARRQGTTAVTGHAETWEWPTRPSFGLPFVGEAQAETDGTESTQ